MWPGPNGRVNLPGKPGNVGKGSYGFPASHPSDLQPKSQNNLSNKKRFDRALIQIEGGGYMLLSRARQKVEQGRAVLVNGLVRFLEDTGNPGYDATKGSWVWSGRQSGHGGPTVLQAMHITK